MLLSRPLVRIFFPQDCLCFSGPQMPIRVTCTGCHARFNVSDKFAGKEGPCPKCKAVIQIPGLDEEVVIHAPENLGPTDSSGRPTLKPISRNETNLSGVQIALISCGILAFFIGAFLIRISSLDESQLYVLLIVGAIAISIPISFAAYTFLRDQERGAFVGKDLWLRISICGAVYALLWLAVPLLDFAFPGNQMGSMVALGAMIGIGGAAGMLVLDLDYMVGILHYGMYLVCCLIGRVIVELEIFPGLTVNQADPETTRLVESAISQLINML